MKKGNWILAAGAALALAAPAFAAIDNSHHDMTTYLGATADSKCFYCHGLPQTIPVGIYGQVGDFCVVRCHQSGSVLGAAGEFIPQGPNTYAETAAGGTITITAGETGPLTLAYNSGSHPVGTSTTDGPAGQGPSITAPDTTAAMIATTWPYTSNAHLSVVGNSIQCTSCHAVHDNDAGTPFLWASMGTQVAPVAASAGAAFCSRCHNGRHDVAPVGAAADVGTIAAFGSHPVEVTWNAATALARTTANSNGRRPRTITMDDPGGTNVFDVPFSSTGSADFDPAANKYQTGGHVGAMTVSLSNGAAVGCYTCHAAHATGTNALLIANKDGIDTSPLCIGCHGPGPRAATTSDSNPGGNGFYHPCNIEAPTTAASPGANLYRYTASNGVFPVVAFIPTANQAGELTPLGTATNQLLCTTCHDVHGAVGSDMSIQNFGQGANGYVCAVCHTGQEGVSENLAAADSHHITYATKPLYFGAAQPSWSEAGGGAWPISIQDRLDCADCHVFNGTAHNW